MDSDQERQPLLGDKNVNTKKQVSGDITKTTSDNQVILRSFVILLFILAIEIGGLTQRQYIYRWVQKNNQTSTSALNHQANHSRSKYCGKNISDSREKDDQKIAAEWTWHFSLAENGIAIIAVIIFGIYSDYIGRKPLLAISLLGYILRYGIASFIVYKELHLIYFYVAYALGGICGCYYTFYIGNMASIADRTKRNKHRSIGLAILEAMTGMGASLGHLGTGYLIKFTGFLYSNVVSTGLCLVNFVIIIFFVNDTIDRVSAKDLSFKSGCKRMFGFYYDKTKIIDGKTWKFNVSIGAFLLSYFIRQGKSNIDTLYQMRSPFCWDAVVLGWFGFVSDIGMFIVGLVGMRILQVFFTDAFISSLGIVSNISFTTIQGLASTSWMLYIAAATGVLSAIPFPLLRSACSSMVLEDLQGALFANLLVMEIVCSLSNSTFSSNIYAATQSFMPGLVFLILGGMFVIPFVMLLLVVFCTTKEKKMAHRQGEQETRQH